MFTSHAKVVTKVIQTLRIKRLSNQLVSRLILKVHELLICVELNCLKGRCYHFSVKLALLLISRIGQINAILSEVRVKIGHHFPCKHST